jgi:molybdopterin molybdotransferase
MISFSEALAIVDRELGSRRVAVEECPSADALGRVLAEDAVSALDLPPFDRAAMDGYALPAGDERPTYEVIENVPAGRAPTRALAPGQATRVMTGAPVPEGTGKVVMWEKTDNGTSTVAVHDHDGSANVSRRGEDIRSGAVLFRAGTRVGAVEVANLVACGITRVRVYRAVAIAVLVTGDEIQAGPEALPQGGIVDANGPLLEALAREHGLRVARRAIVPVDLAAHEAAIETARAEADLVVLTGGVSQGDRDFVGAALQGTGFTIHYDRVSVAPGKPLTFATHPQGAIACGLPGNPVAVLNGFRLVVLRVAARLTGSAPADRTVRLPLGEAVRRRNAERTAFLPCRIRKDGSVVTVPYHGSAHLIALSGADGMLEIPLGVEELPAGVPVTVYPRW